MLTPELAQEIATSITAAIGFNVLVTDRDGRVIGSADPTRVGSLHEASVSVVRRRTEAWHDPDAARRLSGVKPGITLPLTLGQEVVGTVGITGDPTVVRPFGEIVRRQTEIILRQTTLLRLELRRERAVEQLVADIASYQEGVVDAEPLRTRAEELGFVVDLPRAVVVMAVDLRSDGPDSSSAVDTDPRQVPVRLATEVFQAAGDLVAPVGAAAVAVLVDLVPRGGTERGMAALHELGATLVRRIDQRLGAAAWVGIGAPAAGLAELPRSYHEAWSALRIGRRMMPHVLVHDARDFRIWNLLMGVAPRQRDEFRRAMLAPVVAQRGWPEFRRTLIALVEHGLRLTETAEALHVHRNTLLYRLNRLSAAVGADVRTPRVAIALYLACLLDEIDQTGAAQ
ncbi:sugar diacid recognition domain-containing protein [Dactylosporangium sp. AC04546]|uniref:CdaR family transcriptional regulator n=1 Tax=Dactylosporangium sp. AC04546 TaxID=2862460 RepID=UPI001EE06774|nr:sugar diacid recognition domain-containing protein [Dactylosporangium sp. AC04546]WVK86645.1 sugar diacid recognition domain-containing protein [Dactylosporangium sp. AC04546]